MSGNRTTVATIAASAAGQLVLVVSGVLSARLLGVHDRGQLALLVAAPSALAVLASMGLPLALTFFMARSPSTSRHLLERASPVIALQLLLVASVHIAVLAPLVETGRIEGWGAALITVPASLGLVVQQYAQAILQGQRAFGRFNFCRLLPPVFYTLAVLLIAALGFDSLRSFSGAWSATVLLSGLASVTLAVRSLPATSPRRPASRRRMLGFGLRGLFGASLPLQNFQIDQLLVGVALGPSSLGIYVVAAAFTNILRFVSQGIGMVGFPNVAHAPTLIAVRRLSRHYTWLSVAILLCLVTALELALPTLITAFFGHQFAGAIPIARVLVCAAALTGIRRVIADVARGAGNPGYGSTAEAVTWATSAAALPFLLAPYGAEGVAWSLSAGAAAGLVAITLLTGQMLVPARSRMRLHTAHFVAAVLGILIGFAVVQSGAGQMLTELTVFPIATIMVGAVPIVTRLMQGRFDWFEPIVGGVAMLVLLFGIRPLVMVLGHHTRYLGIDTTQFLFGVELLGLVAIIMFIVGYETLVSRKLNSRSKWQSIRNRASARTAGWLFILVALLLLTTFLASGPSAIGSWQDILAGRSNAVGALLSSSSEYFSSAAVLGTCAALLVVMAAGRDSLTRGERRFVYLASALPVIVFFLLGNRRFILPAIVLPLLLHYLLGQKRPRLKSVALVAPLLFLVFATIPFARTAGARQQHGGAVPIFMSALSQPVRTGGRFLAGPDTEMPAALALELRAIDHGLPHAYGSATVGDLLIAPIPHIVYAKPTSARDRLLVAVTGGPCSATTEGGLCPDFSLVGTFYHDFGVFGVVIEMLLFGLCTGMIWGRVQSSKGTDDPALILLAACWVVFVPIIIRAGFMPAFAWFLYFYLPTRLGWALLARHSPQLATRWSRLR